MFCKNFVFSYYSLLVITLSGGQTVSLRANLGTHTEIALKELFNALFGGGELSELCADLSKNLEKANFDL